MQKLIFWILFVVVTRYGTSASSSISSSLSITTTLEPTETTLSLTSFQTTPITASPSKTTSNVTTDTTTTLSIATSSITKADNMQSTSTPFKPTPHVTSPFATTSNIAPSETMSQTRKQFQTTQSISIPSKIITSTGTLTGTISNKVQPSTANASQTTLKIMLTKTTSNIKTKSGIVSNSVPSKATLSTPIPSIASSIAPFENPSNISGNEITPTTTKPPELTSRIGLSNSTSSMEITPSETISDIPSSNSIASTIPSKPTTSSETKLITTNISETNSNIPMYNTTLYISSPEITLTTTTPSKTSISDKTTHKILITSTPIPTTLSKTTLNIAPSKTILSTITSSKNTSSTTSISNTTSNIAHSKPTTCTTTHCKTTLSLASSETTLSTLKSSKTSVSNTTTNQVQFETTPISTTLPKTTLHTSSSNAILSTTTPSMTSNTTISAKILSNTETLSKATSKPSLTTSSQTLHVIINTKIVPTKASSITNELALTTASAIVQPTQTQNVTTSKVTDATTPSIDEKHHPITPNTGKEVKIQFEIEVGDAKTPFDKTLYNHNSKMFKHYKESFENKLENAYKGTPGYRGVEVYAFRKGSIIADYKVTIESYDKVAEAKNHITEKVVQNIPDTILKFSVNKTFLEDNIQQTVKQLESGCEYFSQAVCPTGYRCEMKNKKPICTEICWKEDGSNLCGNHGTCYVDIKTYKGKCSCSNSNGFVYHGVYCERKAEELKLDSVYIIAIASGSGGAVLIIAVVAVACLIHMKRKMKTLSLTNTDVNSAEMDDFGWERSSDLNANLYRARVKSVANDNKTRLQEQDATYFQGREHRLYKDDKGDEAYIYQPSSHKSSAETEYNTGPSVYDYIDTDSKFQIQRPNICIGHLNKY